MENKTNILNFNRRLNSNRGTKMQNSRYSFYVSDAAEKFRRFANTVMPFDVPTTNVVNIEEY